MKSDNSTAKPTLFAIMRGFLTSAVITLAALLICAAVITLGSGLDENAVYIALHITSLAAVFAGSMTTGAHVSRRGMLNGAAVGILYTAATALVGFVITPGYMPGAKTLMTLAICTSSGAVGGILGINVNNH